jgi:hypothetical protein
MAELSAKSQVLTVGGLQRLVEGVDVGTVLTLEFADLGGESAHDAARLVERRTGCRSAGPVLLRA